MHTNIHTNTDTDLVPLGIGVLVSLEDESVPRSGGGESEALGGVRGRGGDRGSTTRTPTDSARPSTADQRATGKDPCLTT
jgi:hypothetical protein